MAKKRITQITVERTAFLTTDYFAIDSATGTNNTGRISGPNLLAQLASGPTSPTFQVSLSTLATAGLGGVSRLARGFDILLSNPKATTAAVEYGLQVASNDAASPLALRFGVKTDATGGSRYGSIEVDDAGTKRPLVLQPTDGNVVIGTTTPATFKFQVETSVDGSGGVFVRNSSAGTAAFGNIAIASPIGNMQIRAHSAAHSIWPSTGLIYSESAFTGGLVVGTGGTSPLRLIVNFSEKVRVTNEGNVGIGQTTFGAGAVKVMAFGNGTEPAAIANAFQLVSADVVAGNAAPHFVTEAGPVIRLYQQAHIPDADGSLGSVNSQLNLLLAAVRNTRLLAAA